MMRSASDSYKRNAQLSRHFWLRMSWDLVGSDLAEPYTQLNQISLFWIFKKGINMFVKYLKIYF